MSVIRVGSNVKYAEGWASVFGKGGGAKKAAKKAAKKVAKKAAKKAAKKGKPNAGKKKK